MMQSARLARIIDSDFSERHREPHISIFWFLIPFLMLDAALIYLALKVI